MIGFIVGMVVVLAIAGGLYWMYQKEKKRADKYDEDLNFFKKEKEYYNEAMLVLDRQNHILFANGAARKLFFLDDTYRLLPSAQKIELKIDSNQPRDFFRVLSEQVLSHNDSFHLKGAIITVGTKAHKVNIFVDQTASNQTVTCVIDMQTATPQVAQTGRKIQEGGIDVLTGLPNQFVALNDINTYVMRGQKNAEPFAMVLLGVDNYDEVEAALGLGYVNQLLKKIANYFIQNPEENTKVYRMDCERFLFIIEFATDTEMVKMIAKKLVAGVNTYNKTENNAYVTVSAGVVRYPEHGENAAKLMNRMYQALAKAQEESDSNVKIYTPEDQTIYKEETKIREEIQRALIRQEFMLFYQPIYNLETESIVGVEALLRWKHPEMGIISADKFLSVAERTGQIVDIGEYVFKEAIRQRKFWDEKGIKNFKITLNLSLKEMKADKLIYKLQKLFQDEGVDPSFFVLDITEKVTMANIEKSMIDFKHFKDLGLSISLEHFGAGFSSLKYLQLLPLSTVKIDKSLIFDLYSNLDHQVTVKAMIKMLQDLGFEVVAEGVETSKESTILYDFGCNYAQGYLFSKPLPANEFERLIRDV